MKYEAPETFALDNFEGPLEFLLHLIQKEEIDIYEVSLQKIMEQYLEKQSEKENFDVDSGAEFIGVASILLFIKSRMLLPKHEQPLDDLEGLDLKFDIIHQLLDYCKFKEAAKHLSSREEAQSSFFGRGQEGPYEVEKKLGVEHLTLQDLALLFKDLLSRNADRKGRINEEVFLVSDKIRFIRGQLKENNELKFENLFNPDLIKEELIVTFLALLELMKMGEVSVIKDLSEIWIRKKDEIARIDDGQRN